MKKEETLKLFEMPKIANFDEFEIYQRKQKMINNYGNLALENNRPPDWYMVLTMEVARGETAREEMYDCRFLLHQGRLEQKLAEMAKYGLTPFDL